MSRSSDSSRSEQIDSSSIVSAVRSFAETLPAGSHVLDVGCGLRPYIEFFVHTSYTGMDVMESGRKSHDKTADIFYDGLNFPFSDASYDAVICTQVLEHSVEPDRLLVEIHRVLRGGGTGLVTVPLTWGEHETPYDFRRYTTFGIRRAVEQAGLEIVRLDRIAAGISAVAMLVSSEINAYHLANPARSFLTKQAERLAHHWWRVQLFLWRKLYVFPRIYLDNLVIFTKPRSPDSGK